MRKLRPRSCPKVNREQSLQFSSEFPFPDKGFCQRVDESLCSKHYMIHKELFYVHFSEEAKALFIPGPRLLCLCSKDAAHLPWRMLSPPSSVGNITALATSPSHWPPTPSFKLQDKCQRGREMLLHWQAAFYSFYWGSCFENISNFVFIAC